MCDHEWEFVDDSFDHEFGREVIRYWECEICGKRTYTCPFEDEEDYDEYVSNHRILY